MKRCVCVRLIVQMWGAHPACVSGRVCTRVQCAPDGSGMTGGCQACHHPMWCLSSPPQLSQPCAHIASPPLHWSGPPGQQCQCQACKAAHHLRGPGSLGPPAPCRAQPMAACDMRAHALTHTCLRSTPTPCLQCRCNALQPATSVNAHACHSYHAPGAEHVPPTTCMGGAVTLRPIPRMYCDIPLQ